MREVMFYLFLSLSCLSLSAQKVTRDSFESIQSYKCEFKELDRDKYREGICGLKSDYTGVPKPPLEYVLELKAVLEDIYKEIIYPKIEDFYWKEVLLVFDEKDDFIRVELSLPLQDRTIGLPDSLIKKFALKVKERVVPSDYLMLRPRVPGYISYYRYGVIMRDKK